MSDCPQCGGGPKIVIIAQPSKLISKRIVQLEAYINRLIYHGSMMAETIDFNTFGRKWRKSNSLNQWRKTVADNPLDRGGAR